MTPIVITLFLLSALALTFGDDCIRRSYGDGNIVCVCNAAYCDTLERPEPLQPLQFITYTSNRAGLRFEKEKGLFIDKPAPTDNKIVVDSVVKYQEIIGWGGAFTDSTGINIKSLSEELQEHVLRSYFSDEGLEYNMGRVPIGGTDFSTHGYSYDDGPIDKDLVNFKLASEDFDYKIPFIKKAFELSNGTIKLFASAWTAPKWMKTNQEYDNFGFLIEEMYQSWANYFVQFLDSYKNEGIEFWGITTGNEPILAFMRSKINSVGWWPDQMNKWITNNLGPTIRNSSYSDIKIVGLDDQRIFLPWILQIILGNEAARGFIDGIGVHWYVDSFVSAQQLTETHNLFPEKFILNTEACNGDLPFFEHVILGSWERGERYAIDIIEDLQNWVSAWVDWNLALDLQGGPTYIENYVDSAIIVNATANEFYKQPMFYVLGHFSKFIPRGSVRISASQLDKDVPSVAFKKPNGETVLIILNSKDESVVVTIADNLRGTIVLELSEKSITSLIYW